MIRHLLAWFRHHLREVLLLDQPCHTPGCRGTAGPNQLLCVHCRINTRAAHGGWLATRGGR